MSNLAARLLSAAVLLPVVISLFTIGGWPLKGLVLLAAFLSYREYAAIVVKDDGPSRLVLVVVGMLVTLGAIMAPSTGAALLVVQGGTMALSVFVVLRPGDFPTAWRRLCLLAFALPYIGIGTASVVRLRDLGNDMTAWGAPSFVLCAFVATWANDTGAYFAGRAFGRHKMAEVISPKKTWEGFLGGALGSIALLAGVRAAVPSTFGHLTLVDLVALAVPIAFLGPIGDLVESLLKRNHDVKDSGNLIPGHGGMLDRIDAVFFTAPWTLAYFAVLRPLWLGGP